MERKRTFPRRRRVLRACGAVGTLALAGCTSDGPSREAADGTGSPPVSDDEETDTADETAADRHSEAGDTDAEADDTDAEADDADDAALDFDTVSLGVLEPFTGALGDLGARRHRGTELAIEWVNEHDEYDFEFEYVTFDTQSDPVVAGREAEEAVQDYGATFVTGALGGSSALAIADVVDSEGVVYVPGAMDDSITGSNCSESVFRFETHTAQMTAAMANWVHETLGDRMFYHVADYAYGESVREGFETRMRSLSDSYAIVDETRSEPGSTDFGPFIGRIQNAATETDALVVGLVGADLVTFLQQAAEHGLQDDVPVVTARGAMVNHRGAAREAAVGTYSAVQYVPEFETGDNQAFVEAYLNTYGGPPDGFAAEGFESVRTLADGIRAARSDDPGAVANALRGLERETIVGPTEFRECDGQAVRPVWMGELVEGDGDLPDVEVLATFEGEAVVPDCPDHECR